MFNYFVEYYSREYDLDPKIVYTIAEIESAWNTCAVRYEENYPWLYKPVEIAQKLGCHESTMRMMQMTSWGILQVMGAVYYEYNGHLDDDKDFHYASVMLRPEIGIKFGCLHLKKLRDRFKIENPLDLAAAYNGGAVRKIEDKHVNHIYVAKFKKAFLKYGGTL